MAGFFRNYVNSEFQSRVEETYKNILEKQNVDYVRNMKTAYSSQYVKKIFGMLW